MFLAERRIVTNSDGRFHLYPIGDLHLDRSAFQLERFKKWRAQIIRDPLAVAIFVGDAVEGRTPGMKHFGVSSLRREFRVNMDSYVPFCLDKTASLFKPITDAGRPLFVVKGNHDAYMQFAGFSAQLADRVKATYLDGAGVIRVMSGMRGAMHSTLIYATHGTGGGVMPGGKVNALQRLREVIDADVYVAGHVHDQMNRILKMPTVPTKGVLRIERRDVAFLRACAFLDQGEVNVGAYDQDKAYPISDNGLIALEVTPKYRKMRRVEARY